MIPLGSRVIQQAFLAPTGALVPQLTQGVQLAHVGGQSELPLLAGVQSAQAGGTIPRRTVGRVAPQDCDKTVTACGS